MLIPKNCSEYALTSSKLGISEVLFCDMFFASLFSLLLRECCCLENSENDIAVMFYVASNHLGFICAKMQCKCTLMLVLCLNLVIICSISRAKVFNVVAYRKEYTPDHN
jgi:hypothetical protein